MEEKILIKPIISEKSVDLAKKENKYTFKVRESANKIQIAKAVGETFDVTVVNVRTLRVRPVRVRFGRKRLPGMKGGWKKAVITLSEGDKIEIFDIK